ncbi:MAG: alpha-ketoacid dehydrogenase subunit alpha/beta [Bacteroidota bacterium]
MIKFSKQSTSEEAFSTYRSLLLPRRIEERMLKLLRQNKISKWFSGIGQEAIAVGATIALQDEDYILPMHRNLGVFTTREVSLYKLFCQLLVKKDGFSRGRERSFHFGIPEKNIVGMISHLAATMPIADGLGLAKQLKGEQSVALSFCGDGATSEGDFHEAINLAAVWNLPVIFMIENNGYGLSTPIDDQYACDDLVDRADGYGIEGYKIDGNDIFEVIKTVREAREHALTAGPVFIEAKTFRMRGHEEASGTFYVPDEYFKEWGRKDPILRYEKWLKKRKYIQSFDELDEQREQVDQLFREELDKALDADDPTFDIQRETAAVWADNDTPASTANVALTSETKSEKRHIDAIQAGLQQAFDEDERFLIMGQDIAEYGGVFKVTEGFLERYGADRVRNTPIIESGAIGAAIGLALEGYKPVVEMQFADFISCGYNQIVNNLSKGRYRWMPPLNLTIRAPHGAGVGAGPFHSQSPEGWFMQHPGLKILVPATVEDAMQLTYNALYDPNPVLIFEHKKLYRSLKRETFDQAYIEPLGKAKVHREGSDATILTYGMGVHWAMEEAEKRPEDIEVVDLRCLSPIDWETIERSVSKTNKVLLLQEPSQTMGPASELSAWISEHCFEYLDAPVIRCSSLDTPVPTNPNLEQGYLANFRLGEKLDQLLSY